jgi:hypothetical protein
MAERWLSRHHGRLWDGALLFGGAFVAILVERLVAQNPSWTMRTVLVLIGLGGVAALLWVLSAIGDRSARLGVTNEDLLREFRDLKKTVASGQVAASTEPSTLLAPTGTTGASGSVASHYEGQGTATATFRAHAAGTVRLPSRWYRFKRFIGVDDRVRLPRLP